MDQETGVKKTKTIKKITRNFSSSYGVSEHLDALRKLQKPPLVVRRGQQQVEILRRRDKEFKEQKHMQKHMQKQRQPDKKAHEFIWDHAANNYPAFEGSFNKLSRRNTQPIIPTKSFIEPSWMQLLDNANKVTRARIRTTSQPDYNVSLPPSFSPDNVRSNNDIQSLSDLRKTNKSENNSRRNKNHQQINIANKNNNATNKNNNSTNRNNNNENNNNSQMKLTKIKSDDEDEDEEGSMAFDDVRLEEFVDFNKEKNKSNAFLENVENENIEESSTLNTQPTNNNTNANNNYFDNTNNYFINNNNSNISPRSRNNNNTFRNTKLNTIEGCSVVDHQNTPRTQTDYPVSGIINEFPLDVTIQPMSSVSLNLSHLSHNTISEASLLIFVAKHKCTHSGRSDARNDYKVNKSQFRKTYFNSSYKEMKAFGNDKTNVGTKNEVGKLGRTLVFLLRPSFYSMKYQVSQISFSHLFYRKSYKNILLNLYTIKRAIQN